MCTGIYGQLFSNFVYTLTAMIRFPKHIATVLAIATALSACSDSKPKGSGPIVLGDSSMIVTETDKQQLTDLVADLTPTITPTADPDAPAPADTPANTQTATAQPAPQPQPQQEAANGNGLRAEFREVTISISGVEVKQAGNKNLQNANGAVYTLTGGKLNGARITVQGGTVTKVSQRYQSVVMVNTSSGDLPLDNLSITSRWDDLKGGNGSYSITGLDAGSLEYADANANTIRNAVERAARRHRMSRAKMKDLLDDVRRVRSVNQKPLHGELRSAMWKIDGKDANGRLFSKQIRIDIPM